MNPNLSRGFFILSLDIFREKKTLENFLKFRMVHFPRKGVVADPNSNFFRNKEQGYKGGGLGGSAKIQSLAVFFLVGASLRH